jgi:hypothetical protein
VILLCEQRGGVRFTMSCTVDMAIFFLPMMMMIMMKLMMARPASSRLGAPPELAILVVLLCEHRGGIYTRYQDGRRLFFSLSSKSIQVDLEIDQTSASREA